jgi:HK97 family phage major capsid protein
MAKTLTELRDAKAAALEENAKIFEARTTENRTMTEKEEAIVALNNQRIKECDLEMETESRKLGTGGFNGKYVKPAKEEEEPFSLIKAIRAIVDRKELSTTARDLFNEGKKMFRDAGLSYDGDIVLPASAEEVRAEELRTKEKRADIDIVSGATHGVEIVEISKKAILPPLVDKLVFTQAGATYMTGLVGNVSIPSYSGTTVGWIGEVSSGAEGGGTFGAITFSPKRLSGYIVVSKQFLLQDGVGAERLLLDNLSNAVARKLESTILGTAVGSATQPQGMGNPITATAHVVPTYAKMVALESSIDTANALVGNLAYITNAAGRGLLKSIDKGVSNDTGDMLCNEKNEVNGYPLLVTNSCSAAAGTSSNNDLLVFGNWRDLCIAQWGGYDITVDPYTLAVYGQVKIVINAYFDAKGLRGAGDGHTDYATSFAVTSILAT